MPTCGAQALAITDGDAKQAARVAEKVGRKFFNMRHALGQTPWTIDEALDQALAAPTGPVVIADRADNAGGGAPSDSTFMLKAILERGIDNAGLAMIWDPIAVQVAISGGVGAKLDIRLGGKMGPMSGDPLDLKVTVTGIVENMIQHWPQQGDPMRIPCGDSVCLHCDGVDIIVSSRARAAVQPGRVHQLRHRRCQQAHSGRQVGAALLCRLRADRLGNCLHGRAWAQSPPAIPRSPSSGWTCTSTRGWMTRSPEPGEGKHCLNDDASGWGFSSDAVST